MEKWAIILYSLGISGGANVIYEHALWAQRHGVEITIVTTETAPRKKAQWHRGTEGFNYITINKVADYFFDVAIATEWRTAFDIYQIRANKYIYFVQSVESRFFFDSDSLMAYMANQSYEINFYYITEAEWIKRYLKKYYGIEAYLIRNGLDKQLFCKNGPFVSKRNNETLRFLIEGSVSIWYKNVAKAVELCKKAGVEELWLVTSDEIESYPGVNRVFSKVDIEKMPKIYRSCDVLVKLSLVEGMFGPPLEMFGCGGTAIVYNVDGADEYIKNEKNALVVEKNNEDGVVKAIQRVIDNNQLVNELKEEASITASNWWGWDQSSEAFYNVIKELKAIQSGDKNILINKALFGAKAYSKIERVEGVIPKNDRTNKVVNSLKKENKRLAIYGAGNLCRYYIKRFAEFDIIIDKIVVSDMRNNPKQILGHRVYLFSDIIEDLDDYLLFISTEAFYDEIYDTLKKYGIKSIV